MKNLRWETLFPQSVDLLIRLASDTQMTCAKISEAMQKQGTPISSSSVTPVLVRLGVRVATNKPKRAGKPVDVLAELEAARLLVSQLEAKAMMQKIHFDMAKDISVEELACLADRDDVVIVYGVTPQFHKLEGMARLLEFIKKWIPQIA